MKQAAIAISATMAARGTSALGGLLLSLLIAHVSGPEGLGAFAVFLSLAGACAILARHGRDMLLTRAVAWSADHTRDGTAVALLCHCVTRVVLPAFVLGVIASGVLASGVLGSAFPGTVVLTPLALVPLTVLALMAGYARGRSRPWLAPLFEIGGISMLTALLLGATILTGRTVTGASVTTGFLVALLLLVLVACLVIFRDMPRNLRIPPLGNTHTADLRRGQVDFTVVALASFLTQAGAFVFAAPFLSEADLGLLRAAERLALLIGFPLLAVNPVIMPRIVRLSRGGGAEALRRLMLHAMLASGGMSACVMLPLLAWPERALALMGAEFGAATDYLRLMALAQFVTAVLGPLATLLHMTGRERASMWINIGALALATGLVPYLSLVYGARGFALAYAAIVVARLGLIGAAVLLSGPAAPRRATGTR